MSRAGVLYVDPANEQITALVSGFLPHERSRRVLMVLQAMVDDSGRGNPPVFVLAGFAAKVEDWLGFPGEWQAVLDQPPRIAYFKMKEAASRTEQFAGFTERERDQRLQNLLAVIENHVQFAFRLVIPHRPYQTAFRGQIVKAMDQPYFAAYFGLMMFLTANQYNQPDGEKIDFVFDEQGKEQDLPQYAYSAFVQFSPDRVKHLIGDRPIHRDEKTFTPLQAADLHGWQARKFYEQKFQGEFYEDPVWSRLSRICLQEDVWTDDRIANIIDKIGAGKRESEILFPYDLPPKLRKKVVGALKRIREGGNIEA